MKPINATAANQSVAIARRALLQGAGFGLGLSALQLLSADEGSQSARSSHALPHFAAKAKRVIFLFQSGGPSQLELFDPKPWLAQLRDTDLPESVRRGQRLTTMTSGQSRFPLVQCPYKFGQHGQGGIWLSELLPHMAGVADELCVVRSLHTEAINHDPAITS
jgi:hypothetical protein